MDDDAWYLVVSRLYLHPGTSKSFATNNPTGTGAPLKYDLCLKIMLVRHGCFGGKHYVEYKLPSAAGVVSLACLLVWKG